MSRIADFLARLPESRSAFVGLLAFLVVIFATGNLPWHLDNYDQAKQAYVAWEIDHAGKWGFQTTPTGRSASKPPLMGWMSAIFHKGGLPWDLAFRLPSFVCALVLLGILAHTGRAVLGQAGAMIAVCAFGLNLLTPRLATLVRTDMMLGFWIFLIGWMIYRKIRTESGWTSRERWIVFGAMAAALLTKGPVIYAFLLPGIVGFALLAPKIQRPLVWSGWWTWLIPFALFVAWGVTGLLTDRAFYDDVVVREFLSRFQEGARDDERAQPLWFYFPHLLHKFAPWSLLLVGLVLGFPQVRRRLRDRPAILWLVLWSMGGLLVMTLIPAKRVDRIYPVLPPLCLLTVEWLALVWQERRVRILTGCAILAGFLFAGGYFVGLVPLSYHERTDALVNFAGRVQNTLSQQGITDLRILNARDEGLLIYLDEPRFAPTSRGFDAWEEASGPRAFLMSDRTAKRLAEKFGPANPVLDSGELLGKNENRYFLFIREAHPLPR